MRERHCTVHLSVSCCDIILRHHRLCAIFHLVTLPLFAGCKLTASLLLHSHVRDTSSTCNCPRMVMSIKLNTARGQISKTAPVE